jgi:formylglycine-generating enzyme required for sulfatase activity
VRRVHDRMLDRTVAMKALRDDVVDVSAGARFLAEARATAQLQHPGTVPVHDVGTLPDGRPFFTMQEVRGRTLAALIKALHAGCRGRWVVTPDGVSLEQLVRVLHQVAQTVAYAHDAGVIHRDLKPANVMVGDFGEVVVVDWGLAADLPAPASLPGVSHRPSPSARGAVGGTPAYMPPEAARGAADALSPRADVYALGAMLYELLGGLRPYKRYGSPVTLADVLGGPPLPLSEGATHSRPLPPALVELVGQAMSPDPGDRPPHAGAMALRLQAWLDGAVRRERAQHLVDRAVAAGPRVTALRDEAAALRQAAADALEGVPESAPEADKSEAWALEDRAATVEAEAVRLELTAEDLYRAALADAPDLVQARTALARRVRRAHLLAEAARDAEATLRAEVRLERLLEALPADHPEAADHRAWLAGVGALTLAADPPASAVLYRTITRTRRLVADRCGELGQTPIVGLPLEHGSWLVELSAPGHHTVRYPVHIARREHHAPASPVVLPPLGTLGPDDCYVPAGPFRAGGDPEALEALDGQVLWCPGFVIRRFSVTNREYIAFLEDLVASGLADDALRWAPRERAGTTGGAGALIFGFDGERFTLKPDVDGDLWQPDWAVVMVDWASAMAFAAWEAARTGEPWRLPSELEWEKAGRGTDGRHYPWGDWLDPSWACIKRSHVGKIEPKPVTAFPTDESPYGVRGLAGGTRDWCLDPYLPEGASIDGGRVVPPVGATAAHRYVERGGTWLGDDRKARLANRSGGPPTLRYSLLGFRLARSWPPARSSL